MHHMRSSTRRTGCFVLINGLLCATVAAESATAQPLHSPFRREAPAPALNVNPHGVPPVQSSIRPLAVPPGISVNPGGGGAAQPNYSAVPFRSAVPPGISVNPGGGGAAQANYPAVPFPAVAAPPYTAPPSTNGNFAYIMSSICMTPAGSCTTYQTQGTQCQCSDGINLYVGVAQ
jgi:hypothetical protein